MHIDDDDSSALLEELIQTAIDQVGRLPGDSAYVAQMYLKAAADALASGKAVPEISTKVLH